ncbi:MAG: hypothetical protein PW843_20135 [Azospirillaceae bacterium]|nr:hypothetical protein [Azospirillaceae bacterium]
MMSKIPSRRSDPPHPEQDEEFRRQAEELAASLDAAEAELERDGPVPPAQFAAMLRELAREWGLEDDLAEEGPTPGP